MFSSIVSALIVGTFIGALGRLVVRGRQSISLVVTVALAAAGVSIHVGRLRTA